MGLRRGKVPSFMWSDIDESGGYIEISKEQLTVKKDGRTPEHFVIVSHTKTYKNRRFPLSTTVREFLARLKAMQERFYPDCQYLFQAATVNGIITNNTVYSL